MAIESFTTGSPGDVGFKSLVQCDAAMSTKRAQYHKRGDCRVCGATRLTRFLELGPQPLANAFLNDEMLKSADEEKFPLDLYVCQACSHVQLLDVVSKETLFSHYLYFS